MATTLTAGTCGASRRTGRSRLKQLGRVNTGCDRRLNGVNIQILGLVCCCGSFIVGDAEGRVTPQVDLATIAQFKRYTALLAGKYLLTGHQAVAFNQQTLLPVGCDCKDLTDNLSNFCAGSHFHDSFHFMWTTAPGLSIPDITREPSASLHYPQRRFR